MTDVVWMPWSGGESPVPNFRYVALRERSGFETETVFGAERRWTHNGRPNDIMEYALIDDIEAWRATKLWKDKA